MKKNEGPQILVIDDEPDVTDLLKYSLELKGYNVHALNNPIEFVSKVRDLSPNLIILDIMMPELDGMQLCQIIRSDPIIKSTPIIFLSARSEVEDRVKGLEHGADDYLTKPFSTEELLLRVEGLLRRTKLIKAETSNSRIQIAGVIIDDALHELTVDGNHIPVTATEFRLLKLLMERKGRVQSRERLLASVWNYDSNIETRTVDTHIRRLREKLGPYHHLIETVRGVGYRATRT
ncbi:MAG: response regulator transcription factor [Verrucomicrobiota bacterium]|nr:response regulator transcription factor [Verrucomicrobiota bacterium]MEC7609674.1 response regulator transcription factor [Verrucomicrobiota bacterium]MEC8330417.1 response regulator transcription factor [Verrucomicrobiota bacterium]MEC8649615.1 response regulator transcription factor [Verrucomicrobiota bacterium]